MLIGVNIIIFQDFASTVHHLIISFGSVRFSMRIEQVLALRIEFLIYSIAPCSKTLAVLIDISIQAHLFSDLEALIRHYFCPFN
jgi:hypothetical protein